MHHLRTTFLRLRPLTAAQAAQRLSQPRKSAITEGSRTCQPSRQLNTSEPFLKGTSSNYVEEMYSAWLQNPKSVHKVQYASTLTCKNPILFQRVQEGNTQPQTFCSHCQSSSITLKYRQCFCGSVRVRLRLLLAASVTVALFRPLFMSACLSFTFRSAALFSLHPECLRVFNNV